MKRPLRQGKRHSFIPSTNGGWIDDVRAPNAAHDEKGKEDIRNRLMRLREDPEYRRQQRLKLILSGAARRSKKTIRMPEFGKPKESEP